MRRAVYEQLHDDFRSTVRAFVQQTILPLDEQHVAQGQISSSVWRAAGDLGLLGLCVPEQYGGAGVDDYRFNAVMDEELTRAGLAYACALGVHTHVIAPYLVHLTTESQRERWLPGVCSGELVTAIAMTEPSGGSDVARMRTRAVREDGHWVLSGSKTFITNGASADLIVVAAQTDPGSGAKGITLFAVAGDAEGLDRGSKLDKIGQPQGDTAELFLDGVRVPDADVLGEVGGGFPAMMKHLAQERLASSVCNVAHADKVLAEAIDHVKQREAFGGTIAQLQHTRFLVAELSTEVTAARALVDSCVAAHVTGDLSPEDAAMAKLHSSEVQSRVVDSALQMFGGMGYMRESQVARDWMDARVTRIWAGTNEIMREVIGRAILR